LERVEVRGGAGVLAWEARRTRKATVCRDRVSMSSWHCGHCPGCPRAARDPSRGKSRAGEAAAGVRVKALGLVLVWG
jgi:hypothetical protein